MPNFSQIWNLDNLRRAYRWVLSNPDPTYKAFFRGPYADYALSSERNIRFLQRQMKQGRYVPTHAAKLFTVKPSGALRPVSLLTVSDQIAYQAVINLVADALYARTHARYRKEIFQHLYAGRSSTFFYLKWQDNYRAYTRKLLEHFAGGYKYIATFDLTAFYDTIDHHVLSTMLRHLRFDAESIEFLLMCLKAWTSSTWSDGRPVIYHGHGIPQGPLSSGMLSEIVLSYLDKVGVRNAKEARYLRYVDDIRIMAKSETALRRRLVALDLAAKEVGLFPQTSKIAIRKIIDPDDEIKSVSRPPEPWDRTAPDQTAVVRRIRELANRGKPKNVTRFKYALAALKPTAKTNPLVLRVLTQNPDLVGSISRHWKKYAKLPPTLSRSIIDAVMSNEVYHQVNAELLELLQSRVTAQQAQTIAQFAYERLFASRFRKSSIAHPQSTYKAALFYWALQSGRMSFVDFEGALRNEQSWWVRQEVLRLLQVDKFGLQSYSVILNNEMRADASDPARAAAGSPF